MDRIGVLLEEYKTLREESLQAIQHQTTILQFGVAGIGLLLGLAAQLRPTEGAAALLFLAIPVLTWLVMVIWHGEVWRMARAGQAIAGLEAVVNHELNDERPTLTWETNLRRGPRLIGRYRAVFFLLLAIAGVSAVAGTTRLVGDHHPHAIIGWLPASVILILWMCWWYRRNEVKALAVGGARLVGNSSGHELGVSSVTGDGAAPGS